MTGCTENAYIFVYHVVGLQLADRDEQAKLHIAPLHLPGQQMHGLCQLYAVSNQQGRHWFNVSFLKKKPPFLKETPPHLSKGVVN